MNAQTVFVFVKYPPPTAVPVLLDDVVELVTSQQLPGVVFVTADCLHGKRVSLIMITLNDCCMLWAGCWYENGEWRWVGKAGAARH